MPFKSDTYRVLIASPSDLADERRIVTDAINEWNAQHAAAEATVLLPVKWETHAKPETGRRPQVVINRQLVDDCDLLIGLFWTKLGTSTGVAESGTVEEIDRVVAAGKPAMLYFSSRPVDPNKIDLEQQRKLRDFKAKTYTVALTETFSTGEQLHAMLLRHLMQHVREVHGRRRPARGDKINEAHRMAELMVSFRRNKITPADLHRFRDELLEPARRPGEAIAEPIHPGEPGPNGHRVGYAKNGDKVEWVPDEEDPDRESPVILRRNDKAIRKAEDEFATVIWYDRKLMLQEQLKSGDRQIDPKLEEGMLRAMAAAEKKYGKRKIRNYYEDDFGWGMLNGKLSALRWVLGDDWDNLDT